jgi:hypothetical protein
MGFANVIQADLGLLRAFLFFLRLSDSVIFPGPETALMLIGRGRIQCFVNLLGERLRASIWNGTLGR